MEDGGTLHDKLEPLIQEYPVVDDFFRNPNHWYKEPITKTEYTTIDEISELVTHQEKGELNKLSFKSNFFGAWKKEVFDKSGKDVGTQIKGKGRTLFYTAEEAANFLIYLHNESVSGGTSYAIWQEPHQFSGNKKK